MVNPSSYGTGLPCSSRIKNGEPFIVWDWLALLLKNRPRDALVRVSNQFARPFDSLLIREGVVGIRDAKLGWTVPPRKGGVNSRCTHRCLRVGRWCDANEAQ